MAGETISRKPKGTITVSTEDISWIKETLVKLTDKVDSIEKTTTKLNTTIVGDPQYGQEGLISTVKDHQEYIHEDKKFKSKLVGGSLVLGVIWTAIVAYFSNHK
jgi:hypothetical protein